MILILDNIRSAYNVGALFRTADGAGIEKLYLVGITPQPASKKLYLTDAEKTLKKNGFGSGGKPCLEKSEDYRSTLG